MENSIESIIYEHKQQLGIPMPEVLRDIILEYVCRIMHNILNDNGHFTLNDLDCLTGGLALKYGYCLPTCKSTRLTTDIDFVISNPANLVNNPERILRVVANNLADHLRDANIAHRSSTVSVRKLRINPNGINTYMLRANFHINGIRKELGTRALRVNLDAFLGNDIVFDVFRKRHVSKYGDEFTDAQDIVIPEFNNWLVRKIIALTVRLKDEIPYARISRIKDFYDLYYAIHMTPYGCFVDFDLISIYLRETFRLREKEGLLYRQARESILKQDEFDRKLIELIQTLAPSTKRMSDNDAFRYMIKGLPSQIETDHRTLCNTYLELLSNIQI